MLLRDAVADIVCGGKKSKRKMTAHIFRFLASFALSHFFSSLRIYIKQILTRAYVDFIKTRQDRKATQKTVVIVSTTRAFAHSK